MKKIIVGCGLILGLTFGGTLSAHHNPEHAVCYKSIAAGQRIVYCYPLPPWAPMPTPAPLIVVIP